MEEKQRGKRSIPLYTIGVMVCAFLGGGATQLVISAAPALAEQWDRFFVIKDTSNPFGVQAFVQNGGTAQKFFDPRGQVRLEMGTYPNGPDAGEAMLAMTDDKGNMRVMLRLDGERQVPVLTFKDSNGKDRMILGLEDMIGEEPYLTTYDSSGQPLVRFNKLR